MRKAKQEELKVILPNIELNLGNYRMAGNNYIVIKKFLSQKKCYNGGRLYNITARHPKYGPFCVLATHAEVH